MSERLFVSDDPLVQRIVDSPEFIEGYMVLMRSVIRDYAWYGPEVALARLEAIKAVASKQSGRPAG